jgi:hypothetical protein
MSRADGWRTAHRAGLESPGYMGRAKHAAISHLLSMLIELVRGQRG